MKNIEKYEHEISKLVNKGNPLPCAIAIAAGISNGSCSGCKCSDCQNKCLEWMYSEYNEPILSDDEKDIVKALCDAVNKFGCTVNYVIKHDNDCNSYIRINCEKIVSGRRETIYSPYFTNDKFKGMETGKEYTIEELGIELEKQNEEY